MLLEKYVFFNNFYNYDNFSHRFNFTNSTQGVNFKSWVVWWLITFLQYYKNGRAFWSWRLAPSWSNWTTVSLHKLCVKIYIFCVIVIYFFWINLWTLATCFIISTQRSFLCPTISLCSLLVSDLSYWVQNHDINLLFVDRIQSWDVSIVSLLSFPGH